MTSYRTSILAVAALALGAGCSSAPPAPTMPPMSAEEAARYEATLRLATPGPEHAALAKAVGHWENSFRMHWAPDQPWVETTGTGDITSMLGGRYIMEHVAFDMMGTPMTGMSITGYDKHTGEYTSLWADSMSTWWTSSRGTMAADGTITFKGTMTDVSGTRPFRMVFKSNGETSHMEMYDTIAPLGEVLVMTMDGRKVSDKPGR